MKILFYTMNWYPFEGSIQHIYGTILKYLKNNGYAITILTSIPYFMNSREERWEKNKGRLFITERWDGIKTVRTLVLSPYFMRKFKIFMRVVNCISFSVTSLFVGMFLGKQDIILTVSHPPLLIGITSFIISRINNCKYIYCLEDIYPDILVDLKILKRGLLFALFRKIELFIYNKSEKICVLSQQMKENLLGKGTHVKKIEVIPHFADLEKILPLPKRNPFAEEYGLDAKFVVLLPGSISYRYNIDTIIDSAKLLANNKDIRFVFIERGELKDIIKKQVTSQRLKNIIFLQFQSTDRFPQLLATADVCLVSLDIDFSSYSVPSKIYNIMASARPVISLVNEKNEVSRIVKKAECGVCTPPNDPNLLAMQIEKLSNNKELCRKMGARGRQFAEKHFNQGDICKMYKQTIFYAINIKKYQKTK